MFDEEHVVDDDIEVEEDISSTYLTFDLGDQTLGVEVLHVREIIDRQKITRLPNAPMDVLGVVDVRGASVPIVDLRSKLGLSGFDLGDDARIVVFELGQAANKRALGIEADRVRNVDRIIPDEVEAIPSQGLGDWDSRFLRGLWRRGTDLVVLVDLERVLGTEVVELDMSAGAGFFS